MKKIKVILSFIIVLLILTVPISETSVFAAAPSLGSAASIDVVNHSKINLSIPQSNNYSYLPTGAFYDGSISSAHLTYSPTPNNLGSCYSKSNISNNSYSSSSTLKTFPQNGWIFNYYHIGSAKSGIDYGTQTCNDTQINIPGYDFHNTGNFGTVFQFVNASEIEATDQNHIFNLTNNSNGTLTYSYSYQGCTSTITTQAPDNQNNHLVDGHATNNASNATNAKIPITSGNLTVEAPTIPPPLHSHITQYHVNSPFSWQYPFLQSNTFPSKSKELTAGWAIGTSCSSYKLNINLDDPTVNGQLATDIAGPGISNQSSPSSSSPTPSLNCGLSWNPLNWLFCGLIKLSLTVVAGLNNVIYTELNLGTCNNGGGASSAPNQIFGNCGGTNGSTISSAYHTAWDQFRNIALALLVIMTLIIIIAQAIKG